MGKAETKFANTAKKMDSALLRLLETTAFEKISVTMLCNEAKVNRSTFYAHYANTSDLLNEVRRFALKDLSERIKHLDANDSLINQRFLIAYMDFLEENSALFLTTSWKAKQISSNVIASDLQDRLENSILNREALFSKNAEYKLQFASAGIARLLTEWLQGDPREKKERMADIILECIPE